MQSDFTCLAMQDILQVVLVILCVCGGWSVWSVMLRFLTPAADIGKVVSNTIDFEESKTHLVASCDMQAPTASGSKNYLDVGLWNGLDILEHYGAFGAAPGTWSTRTC